MVDHPIPAGVRERAVGEMAKSIHHFRDFSDEAKAGAALLTFWNIIEEEGLVLVPFCPKETDLERLSAARDKVHCRDELMRQWLQVTAAATDTAALGDPR